ncbi:EAL domain-containing protein [Celerinatantimonas sp. MCCC 1A17872]|uniref:EAL domain-containing protein n=1 Tax=Celerinatantimonas sp. MCCC 1A17872 TaxID=3177514 RepID=UPI0038C09B3B
MLNSYQVYDHNTIFDISPRVEKVCLSSSGDVDFYELLSSVYVGKIKVDPQEFFDKFDLAGLYIIYNNAIRELKGMSIFKVSVNINKDFLYSKYIEKLATENKSSSIFFEISEAEQFKFSNDAYKRLEYLRDKYSIQFILDDFGAKNSNFDFIIKNRFHAVKIDKSAFWDFFENDKEFLSKLIGYLKLKTEKVVIEGVDSYEKYIYCQSNHCLMQGYFLERASDLHETTPGLNR